jgi:uncharacterized repeat protein (TIGR03803 family)
MKTILCTAVTALTCTLSFSQQYKVLYSFAGAQTGDGANPISSLVSDELGNLYGTTQNGGSNTLNGGTVFELSPAAHGTWTETVLYSFCSQVIINDCLDGQLPQAGLLLDSAGNLYGTAYYGGGKEGCGTGSGCGVAFELSPPSSPGNPWTETVLHSFCANLVNQVCLDGELPTSQLILDASGNLYGTSGGGGSGHDNGGTVFELSPDVDGWTETVLYNFCSLGQGSFCPDGAFPRAGVTFDKSGNLYGTTMSGGTSNSTGGGTIYELSPNSGVWTETVLFASAHPLYGSDPEGGVALDGLDNIYATFTSGGQRGDLGGVFKLALGGSHAAFWFDGPDGANPGAGVLIDFKRHAVYGTTFAGGHGTGTIFEMAPPAQETVLYSFCQEANCADGGEPQAGLIEDKSGNLYGTAKSGGINDQGVVFEISR